VDESASLHQHVLFQPAKIVRSRGKKGGEPSRDAQPSVDGTGKIEQGNNDSLRRSWSRGRIERRQGGGGGRAD